MRISARCLAMIALLLWLVVPTILTAPVANAAGCLTYAQAKKAHKGAYLYWHTVNGRRCWAERRVRTATQRMGGRAPPQTTQVAANFADNLRNQSDEKQPPKNEPQLFVQTSERLENLLEVNHPDWAWDRSHAAVAGGLESRWPKSNPTPLPLTEADRTIEFSTFAPGQEPDVWPQIETTAPWKGAVAGGLLALLLLAWAWFWPSLAQQLAAVGVAEVRSRRAGS